MVFLNDACQDAFAAKAVIGDIVILYFVFENSLEGTIMKLPIYPSAGSGYRCFFLLFTCSPTSQPKNYAIENGGYLG